MYHLAMTDAMQAKGAIYYATSQGYINFEKRPVYHLRKFKEVS